MPWALSGYDLKPICFGLFKQYKVFINELKEFNLPLCIVVDLCVFFEENKAIWSGRVI